MTKRFKWKWKYLAAAIGPILLIVALAALHHELKSYRLQDIVREFRAKTWTQIALATLFTILGYGALTGYDTIAFRYIKNPLSYWKIAFGAFVGYAFSNTVGFSVLTSGSIRYRLYSAWGLSGIDISKIIAFCSFAYWMGFLAICGILFLGHEIPMPTFVPAWIPLLKLSAVICLGIPIAYVLLSGLRKKPLRVKGLDIPLPPVSLSMFQIFFAACDWIFMAAILYAYLPSGSPIDFLHFLTIFLFAQLAAVTSHVPGGLGVFETVAILLLSPDIPAHALMGSIVAFRLTYFLLPFFVAVLLLGIFEVAQNLPRVRKPLQGVSNWSRLSAPQLLSAMTFIGGMTLLFSSALPAKIGRLLILRKLIPVPVIEISHLLAIFLGVKLLFLSRGLFRKLRFSYNWSLWFLCLGALASLLKGGQIVQATVLFGMAFALFASRAAFNRHSPAEREVLPSPGWFFGAFTVIALYVWLGLFSYKHIQYSNDLWIRFQLYGDGSRFLRGTLLVALSLLGMGIYWVVRLVRADRESENQIPTPEQLQEILRDSSQPRSSLALLDRTSIYLGPSKKNVILYSQSSELWIAWGDPLGGKELSEEAIWRFFEESRRHSRQSVFYDVSEEFVSYYSELGLSLYQIGEEALISPKDKANEAQKSDFTLQVLDIGMLGAGTHELIEKAKTWQGQGELSFNESYIKSLPIAILKNAASEILAFTTLWISGNRKTVAFDLLYLEKRDGKATLKALVDSMTRWAAEHGFEILNLGLVGFTPDDPKRGSSTSISKIAGLFFPIQNFSHPGRPMILKTDIEDKISEFQSRFLACPGGGELSSILKAIERYLKNIRKI